MADACYAPCTLSPGKYGIDNECKCQIILLIYPYILHRHYHLINIYTELVPKLDMDIFWNYTLQCWMGIAMLSYRRTSRGTLWTKWVVPVQHILATMPFHKNIWFNCNTNNRQLPRCCACASFSKQIGGLLAGTTQNNANCQYKQAKISRIITV